MEKYIVYLHFNKINKKKYFGITKQKASRRFRKNGEGYKHSPAFYAAIQKYGWENFEHIILKDNLTKDKAITFEKWLINYYNTTDSSKGYNISPGGEIVISSEKISESNKKRWQDGVYDKVKNQVYCVELKRTFESALEAERQTGIDNSSIQKVCKNKLKYVGYSPKGEPLHWLFLEDKTEEKIKELYYRKEIIKGVKIPVFCIELNELFNSTQEVYDKYQIDPSSIRKAVKDKEKTAGKHPITNEKLHWIEKKDLIETKNKITQENWDKLIK